MAKNFNLTANLVLAGPSNLKPIVSQIQSALNNIKADDLLCGVMCNNGGDL